MWVQRVHCTHHLLRWWFCTHHLLSFLTIAPTISATLPSYALGLRLRPIRPTPWAQERRKKLVKNFFTIITDNRRGNSLKLFNERFSTNLGKFSFVNRIGILTSGICFVRKLYLLAQWMHSKISLIIIWGISGVYISLLAFFPLLANDMKKNNNYWFFNCFFHMVGRHVKSL